MVSLPVRVVVGVVGRPELECWFQSSSGWNGVVRGGGAGSSCKCNRSGGRKVTLGAGVALVACLCQYWSWLWGVEWTVFD